jgi:hypothetical protein
MKESIIFRAMEETKRRFDLVDKDVALLKLVVILYGLGFYVLLLVILFT